MLLTLNLTAGQRDTLKDLLYDQTQVPGIMNPNMARAIYEEIDRADVARKSRAKLGESAQDGRQTRPATPDNGRS